MINQTKQNKLISVVVYLHNNQNTIVNFLTQIINKTETLFEEFEIIVVNDFSTDDSVKIIKQNLFLKNYKVSVIQLSFHQGVELAMKAGLDLSAGDFVYEFDTVLIDYDLQLLEQAYFKLIEGFDIVSVSPQKNDLLSSKLFYLVYNFYSKSNYKLRTDRFRLLSRRAINRAFSISVTIPYRKAMYINSGLKLNTIPFKSTNNLNKSNTNSFFRNKTAINALIIYTNLAFNIAIAITILLLIITLSTIIYTCIIYFSSNKPIEGWTTLMLLISIGFSGFFLIAAIIIKYLALILETVFKKKTYIQENIEKI